jgi:tRNA pseudouridine38-40 synthase
MAEEAGRSDWRQVAALVGYDGTTYHGFQVQAGVPTVQQVLEESLSAVATLSGRITGSGRTDRGVHARGQVIGLALEWRHDLNALRRAWNAHLPPDIVIRQVVAAPEGFHPRFSARQRTYRYFVREGAVQEPLSRRYVLDVTGPLDIAAMQTAAQHLVGTHDFATFGQPPQGESTVRTLFAADWHVDAPSLPQLGVPAERRLVFTVTANAFLQHMVRKVVGTLLEVGRGRRSVADFAGALQAAHGAHAAPPAPPCGLVLEWVTYPEEWQLFAEPALGKRK